MMKDDELYEKAGGLLASFIGQCVSMAEENWCPSQVDMLERLFGAVLKGVPYDEWEPDERNEEYLKSELDELYETCSSCPHENDLGKEACDGCGINSSIRNIRMELEE